MIDLHAKCYSRARPLAIAGSVGCRAFSGASPAPCYSSGSTCKEIPLNNHYYRFLGRCHRSHPLHQPLTSAESSDCGRPWPDIGAPSTCPDTWCVPRQPPPGRRSPSSRRSAGSARNRTAGKSSGISAGRSSRPPDPP